MSGKKVIIEALIENSTENNRHYLVNLISDMVKIKSYTGESKEIQHFLRDKLAELGMDTRMIKVDPGKLDKYKGFSRDGFSYDNRYCLVGEKKGKGSGRSIILNGHVDVVPPGDLNCWDDDPLSGKYKDGKIYGRGALDMKGGLAAALIAVKVLNEIHFNNFGDIYIASVCGEETGGCGSFALVDDGIRADGCIILEPTRLKVCHIQSGCHTFRIVVRGRSIHACMAYKGINVIDKFYLIYDALKAMDRMRHERFKSEYTSYYENPSNIAPLNIGTLTAGEWPSSVPDLLEANGRIGIFPGETVEEMHNEVAKTIREAALKDSWLSENQPEVEWHEGLFEPAVTSIDNDLVKTIAESHRAILGRKLEYEAATYGSDMRIFKLYGRIPTILYGPGDVSHAHTVNENIDVDQVIEAIKSLALTLIKWSGGNF